MSSDARHDISLSTVFTVVPDQVSCDVHDEVVILNVRDGVYYGLNAVAARVWQLLQEPRTGEMIRDTLLEEFDVDVEECTSNLLELLDQLKQWNLIESRNGTRNDC